MGEFPNAAGGEEEQFPQQLKRGALHQRRFGIALLEAGCADVRQLAINPLRSSYCMIPRFSIKDTGDLPTMASVLFFDRTADKNLTIENIYTLATGLVVMFEKLASRHS